MVREGVREERREERMFNRQREGKGGGRMERTKKQNAGVQKLTVFWITDGDNSFAPGRIDGTS